MTYRQFRECIRCDIFRYTGNNHFNKWGLIWNNVGLRYTIVMRILRWTRQIPIFWPLFLLLKWYYAHLSVKYGIDIPYDTIIGHGLFIGHYGGIVINQNVIFGKNCNLNHGVTIGIAYGGKYPGCPKIGNNVFFGAGCKAFGAIQIGDNVAIGANCVVTKDIPNNAVVVGIPGNVISFKGSGAYVVDTI